jgi:CheY-like chemotaxis protein
MLSMFVALHGHRAVAVAEGEEAIATILRARPDVALIDIGLPGMDGYEVAKRLRAEPAWADVFVVALTGYGQEEDRRLSQEAGIDHHLVKPVDFEAVRSLIAEHALRAC